MDPALLGARIRMAREQRGISQDELARLLSRDQRSISEYENGKRRLAALDIPRLAEILDVSVLFFFEDAANPHDLDQTLLEVFHALPSDAAKTTLIEIARVLVASYE